MRSIMPFAAMAAVVTVAAPAAAQELVTAPFTTPSTGTSQLYSGLLNFRVSGTGFSNGALLNDAFYNVPSGSVEPSGYYQLGLSTSPLTPFDANNAVVNLLGYRPAYNASHVYNFSLDVGSTPTRLYFGVTDGQFIDNGGAFEINVAPVPEPATWALMIAGFGVTGSALRRRRVRFAHA